MRACTYRYVPHISITDSESPFNTRNAIPVVVQCSFSTDLFSSVIELIQLLDRVLIRLPFYFTGSLPRTNDEGTQKKSLVRFFKSYRQIKKSDFFLNFVLC